MGTWSLTLTHTWSDPEQSDTVNTFRRPDQIIRFSDIMCSGFTLTKSTLIGLNVVYMLVSFIIIGVAAHSKFSGIITSLPIIGGITASGVFLLFVSVLGIIGAMRQHQVMLFIYMIILFFIFILQFSCSCAALSVSEEDQRTIILKAWTASQENYPKLIIEAERAFDCCGVGITAGNATNNVKPTMEDHEWSIEHMVFKEGVHKCFSAITHIPMDCYTCYAKLYTMVQGGFNTAGGLGLFFSIPELLGAVMAYRYRNLMDPFAHTDLSK